MSVMAIDRVEHGDVDVLAHAGALAVAQRGEDADRGEEAPRPMSPMAPDRGDQRAARRPALYS